MMLGAAIVRVLLEPKPLHLVTAMVALAHMFLGRREEVTTNTDGYILKRIKESSHARLVFGRLFRQGKAVDIHVGEYI